MADTTPATSKVVDRGMAFTAPHPGQEGAPLLRGDGDTSGENVGPSVLAALANTFDTDNMEEGWDRPPRNSSSRGR